MSAPSGKKKRGMLITAGPTREKIDPVRFISNYSTGTFGYELAREAKRRGYAVTLVSGPTSLKEPKGVRVIHVESACQMREAVMRELPGAGYLIMAAAVSDWRPRLAARNKIKKGASRVTLELVENPDILAEAGKKKKDRVTVGFALETGALEKKALKKLREKNADLIVANQLTPRSSLFGDNKTNIIIMDKKGGKARFRHGSKRELAKNILDKVLSFKI
jgi:phosphopantothenoylcysteine decarboxylase/phosphopantothenate--cysteine ligase